MLTPQEQARLSQLLQKHGSALGIQRQPEPEQIEQPQDDRGYITGHLGPAVGNFLPKLSHAFGEGFYGLADIATGATDAERELDKQERARRWGQVTMKPAPSTGTLDTVTDVAGEIAPRLGAALLPAGIVSKAATAVRAPAMLANLAGDVAAGTLSGLGESPQEAGIQATEFGVGGLATEAGRRLFGRKGAAVLGSLGNMGVAAGGQALRGNDLTSKEALTNIALQGAFPVAMEGVGAAMGRRFGRQGEVLPPTTTELPPEIPTIPRRIGEFDAPPMEGQPIDYEIPTTPQQLRNAAEENRLAPETITATSQETGGEILNEIPKKLDIEAPETGLRKFNKSERGTVSPEVMQNIAASGTGALTGAVLADDDSRLEGALIGAGLGVGGLNLAKQGRRIFGKEGVEAAVKQEQGERSMLGAATRNLQQTAKLGRSAELDTAVEMGKGRSSFLEGRLKQSERNLRDYPKLPEPLRIKGDEFLMSAGAPDDIAKLEVSGLSPKHIQALKDQKEVQRLSQGDILSSVKDPARRKQIEETLGTYQSNQYGIFTRPKDYKMDETVAREVAKERLSSPEFAAIKDQPGAEDVVLHSVKEWINDLQSTGKFNSGSGNRVSKSLFIGKKELTEPQWKTLEKLRGDIRLSDHERMVVADIVNRGDVRPADQEALKQIVGSNRTLRPEEVEPLKEIAGKSILSDAQKRLLGEIRDPLQRTLLTNAKLQSSVKSAVTINQIAKGENAKGKFALDPKDWQQAVSQAVKDGNKEQQAFLNSMRTLPDSPELGALRGAKVQPEVYDELVKPEPGWLDTNAAMPVLKSVGQALRTVYTRLNPAAWVHNYGQLPTQAMASGVAPWELVATAKEMKNNKAFMQELQEGNMLDVHSGTTFSDSARSFEDTLKPRRFGKAQELWDKGWEKLSQGYGLGDSLVRASAYRNNKADALKLGASKGLTGDALEQFARKNAIQETNRYTYNYGNQAKLVKTLRDIPLINTFLPYTAETVRIMKNLAEDLLQGDGVKKIMAAKRLSAMLAVPVAAATAIEAGMNGDETEEFKKMKKMMPPWMRGRLQVGLGRNKDGQMESFNMTPWTQAGDLIATARSLVTGDFEAALENNPIFGLQKTPLLNIAAEQILGRETFTGKKLTSGSDRLQALARGVAPSLTPGIGYAARRLEKGFAKNAEGGRGLTDSVTGQTETPGSAALAALGFSISTNTPAKLRSFVKRDADEKIAAEKKKMRTVLRMNVPADQKEEARQIFRREKQKILTELRERIGQ